MPQPKSKSGRKATSSAGSRRSGGSAQSSGSAQKRAAAPPPADPGRREQVLRRLNPLDVVVVTRERLQEVVDDAVKRGRMTRSDATDLVTEIFTRGRRTTEDVIGDIEQLLGGPADRVRREMDRARRATGLGPSFPISGYDELSAAKVQGRLGDLTPAQLRKVRDYERRNANRKTVLEAIEQKLG